MNTKQCLNINTCFCSVERKLTQPCFHDTSILATAEDELWKRVCVYQIGSLADGFLYSVYGETIAVTPQTGETYFYGKIYSVDSYPKLTHPSDKIPKSKTFYVTIKLKARSY